MKIKFVRLLPFLVAYIGSYFLQCCEDFAGFLCFYLVLIEPQFEKLYNVFLDLNVKMLSMEASECRLRVVN